MIEGGDVTESCGDVTGESRREDDLFDRLDGDGGGSKDGDRREVFGVAPDMGEEGRQMVSVTYVSGWPTMCERTDSRRIPFVGRPSIATS